MDARELAENSLPRSRRLPQSCTIKKLSPPRAPSRLDDVVHIKRAMEHQVMPFLKELEHHFGAKHFSFAPQVDIDHKPVGVPFRISDGHPPSSRPHSATSW